MAVFKNDLMQLVVNCEMNNDIRSKVCLDSNLSRFRFGNYSQAL
jgi:hypothetical protein